jgi:S-DNA-T family DNA segregation ATPase FtsK/SpoIIIE
VLRQEIDARRRILADARAESLSALRRQTGTVVVSCIIVLQRIVADGRQVGIHVVMTTNRQLGVPSALTSAMAARVVLRMASSDELMSLGVPRDVAKGADLGDGRGFLGGTISLQVAVVGGDPSGVAQADAITELGAKLRADGVEPAPALPELPESISLAGRGDTPMRPEIGVADLTLEPVHVDLTRQNLLVMGPPMSGRTTALAMVAAGIAGTAGPAKLIALGGLGSPLADLDHWDRAGFGRNAQAEALDEAVLLVGGYEGNEVRLVLFIDAVEDVDSIENGSRLEQLVRSEAVRVVAVVDPSTMSSAFSGWTAQLKRDRSVLYLQPGSAAEVEVAAGRKPVLRPGQPFPPGRAVLLDRRSTRLLQVGRPEGFAGESS